MFLDFVAGGLLLIFTVGFFVCLCKVCGFWPPCKRRRTRRLTDEEALLEIERIEAERARRNGGKPSYVDSKRRQMQKKWGKSIKNPSRKNRLELEMEEL